MTGDLAGPLVAGQNQQAFIAIPSPEQFSKFRSGGEMYVYFLVGDRKDREYTSERRFRFSDFRWTVDYGRDGFLFRRKLETAVGLDASLKID